MDSPPKLISEVSEPNVKAQLVYKNGKCKGLGKTTIDFTCNDENQQVYFIVILQAQVNERFVSLFVTVIYLTWVQNISNNDLVLFLGFM